MDAVEDIKNRLSIEDVISRYVELKRAGRNFRGLSPFNSEKTPSFMVSPEKQIWHDFSSGKGGNMFSFIMEVEGIDFKEALELLARQAGVDLSQYRNDRTGKQGQQKERLLKTLELATKFYQVHFSKNNDALEYILKERGFSKEIALKFRIGYAPSSGGALTKFLLGKGFSGMEIKQAGLSTQRSSRVSDMFRDRIMIPLMDPFGKVIGFTARSLIDHADAPKYINTPATMLYDKSRHVFGLHLAKEAIRKEGYVVVVEGNLDVIASHQINVNQVVATAGTAMTEQHLKLLGRLTKDIRIAFDQDKAGLQAAERTIPIAGSLDISLNIITVTDGKDPDELIKIDPRAWQKVISNPQYALDWLIERYQSLLDINSAQGKRQFSDILLKVIRLLPDSVEQDHYIIRIAQLTGVSPDAMRTKLVHSKPTEPTLRRKNVASTSPLDKNQVEARKTQNHFLALMLMQPGLRMYLKVIKSVMMPDLSAQQLLKKLAENPKHTSEELTDELASNTGDYLKMLVLLYEELYQGLELLDLRYEAAQLQARLIRQYVQSKKTEIAYKMRDTGETPELLEQAKELDILLNEIKEKVNG